jgi:hypothetical protein
MSTSNQVDAIAQMLDTITLVTGTEQIKGMTEDALESIDGGAGSSVSNGLEAASQAASLGSNLPGKAGGYADGASKAFDLAAKATDFIDQHPGIGQAAKSVEHDVSSFIKSIF